MAKKVLKHSKYETKKVVKLKDRKYFDLFFENMDFKGQIPQNFVVCETLSIGLDTVGQVIFADT